MGVTCNVQFDRCRHGHRHIVICSLTREDGVEISPGDVLDDKLIGHFVLGVCQEAVIHQVVIPPPGHAGAWSSAQHLNKLNKISTSWAFLIITSHKLMMKLFL